MIDVEKLKRERQELIVAMRTITDAAEKRDNRKLSQNEAEDWEKHDVRVKEMTEEIRRSERTNALEMENAPPPAPDTVVDPPEEDRDKFSSFGEFLLAVREADSPGGTADKRLRIAPVESRASTGQGTAAASDAGYLTQADQMSEIFKRAYDNAVIANACRKIPVMGSGIRMNGIDETSRKAGSRWGGVRGYWAAEAETATASKIKFAKIKMDLEKLLCFVYCTDESLEDAVQLEEIVSGAAAAELAFLLDKAIVDGTGGGVPLGVLNSDALVTISKETGQAANTIVYENIIKMRSRLWARSRPNSRWYINQDAEPELHSMAYVVGTGGVPVYLPASGISGSPYDKLYGADVIPTEHNESVGTAGDILLMDPTQYLIIDKGGVKKAASIHVRFLYEESVFRFTYRVNGQPLWQKHLTPAKGSNTQSPFVVIESRT